MDDDVASTIRQVIGCSFTQETRVQSMDDDVASIIRQALHIGVPDSVRDRVAILQVHAETLNIPRGGSAKYDEDALLHRTAAGATDGNPKK
jgi:hypothetical protein